MDVGKLYHSANKVSFAIVFDFIKNVKHLLKDEIGDRKCKLLDVGTGDGRVLSEIIIKESDLKFEKALGVDINDQMLNFAKKTYVNDLMKFEKLNIEDKKEVTEFLKHHNNFDIATSYYCLQWILDIEQALKNISEFLKPNGIFHFVFLKSFLSESAFIEMANSSKYHEYKNDILKWPCFTHSKNDNIDKYFENILKNTGFTVKLFESKTIIGNFETKEGLKNFFAMMPFLKAMPDGVKEEFLNDYVEKSKMISREHGLSDFEIEASFLNCFVVKCE
ncbi:hypothetical protein PVAND_009668 [Polypedilum vanderplanki]|uniref:Juvenile hormone acid methyltransferase n=1 Tax=Polypedilum vanderplanki TaxID=319348 RepID=A0A9J6CDX1_POLVA|nr:hypothetical protein PVAND_009668 [Polypedilum vanderplanki]